MELSSCRTKWNFISFVGQHWHIRNMTTEPFSITGQFKENFVLTFAQHNLLVKEVMACVFQQRIDLVDHIQPSQLSSVSQGSQLVFHHISPLSPQSSVQAVLLPPSPPSSFIFLSTMCEEASARWPVGFWCLHCCTVRSAEIRRLRFQSTDASFVVVSMRLCVFDQLLWRTKRAINPINDC